MSMTTLTSLSAPLLEAIGVSREADDGTRLLDDVSLSIAAGSSTAIVGPPGSGKTLLMRTFGLLDPLRSGEVRFRGEPIEDQNVPRARRQVMLVAQRPSLFEGTVRDNLRLPASFGVHVGPQFDEKRVIEQLQSLGRSASFLDRDVGDLSGGESQIVALLRAFQAGPTVLLLDEPTSSLDGDTAKAVEALIADWRKENDERSIALVTHTLPQAQRLATRIVRMRDGTIESVEEVSS